MLPQNKRSIAAKRGHNRRKVRAFVRKVKAGFVLSVQAVGIVALGGYVGFLVWLVNGQPQVVEAEPVAYITNAVRSEYVPSVAREAAPEPVAMIAVKPADKPGQPPQSLKDAISAACLKRFTGSEASQCYYDVLAISKMESGWRNVDGDGGKSFGAFQIYTTVHKHVTREMAEDFAYAAEWTVNRMVANGYPEHRTWAIGSHNSYTPAVNARYAAIVKPIAAQLRDQSL